MDPALQINIFSLVEAINGANFYAIGEFAVDAVFGTDVGYGVAYSLACK
ncbi:hypothetical protein RUM4293_00798 [Ruegeria atlantica]|uniref:Uncharacterized protein n=1 Tax=Ruegeria atlantica TaxID=81569 RepID=A0A0P1E165_9RHOB|nr:hypothetical protein [Ruegeria atlantica]CUH41914.1 hypothetical protein RUM4293_00798 [Ruegeria atlantica]